ncbi:MFS transporter [Nonomuraea sp. NPDC005650]|uniref:MFS transporter n=1 Tax=Nonomuraea sp. NPDC005650 TaxID=3157045 RepID=UPI0033B86F46
MKRKAMKRGYGALLWSLFLVDLGGAMVNIALPLLLAQEYGVTFAVGLTFAAGILPRIVASPFVGSLLVRFDPRPIAVISALLTAPLVALLPLTHSLWQFQVLNLTIGIVGALAGPSRLALRPLTIEEGEELRGNGLLVAAERVPVVLGPALVGGVAAAGLDLRWTFWFPVVLAVIAALLIFRIPSSAQEREPSEAGKGFVRLIAEHTRLLLDLAVKDSFIRGLTLTGFTYVAAVSVGRLVLLGLSQERFTDAPGVYGWLLGAMSLGAIVGGALSGRLSRFHCGTLYLVGNVAEAIAWLGLIVVHDKIVSIVILFLAGVLEAIATVVFFAEVQRRVDAKLVGYYYAALMPVIDAFGMLGFVLGGALAPLGTTFSTLFVAALMGLPVLLTARWYYTDGKPAQQAKVAGASSPT